MTTQVPEVPRETQRFILAAIFICCFFISFWIVFGITHDLDIAKTVLTVLAGGLSTIIGFFFGIKTGEALARRT